MGTLYVVATPIGHLGDITYRAVEVLRAVDCIACEDTRHSRILLDHYGIHKPLVSYYREREAERAAAILARLTAGESVALLSDAGAPLISDPGARLVAEAAAAGVRVVPLPGASAPTAALMASGLAADADTPVAFVGFLPARSTARRRRLAALGAWEGVVVLFETPHRLLAALADMEEIWGAGRPLTVARELTKVHEELLRGSVASARAHFAQHAPRGEFTLVAGPPPSPAAAVAPAAPLPGRKELKEWARRHGLSRSEAFRRWQSGYTDTGGD
ncbi:MAG: 16S rRNA (cytidine(1402)-2'-O)-methyltransferase [Terriglobales bacterium]